MAGIAAYVKALRPGIKVIGVEPTGGCLPACLPSFLPACWAGSWAGLGGAEVQHATLPAHTASLCTPTASAGANAMAQSLACGERVTLSKVDAFAGTTCRWHCRLPGWPGAGWGSAHWRSLATNPPSIHPAAPDGVAVKYVGAETFRMCRELLDGVVLVDNAATSAAIKVRVGAGR